MKITILLAFLSNYGDPNFTVYSTSDSIEILEVSFVYDVTDDKEEYWSLDSITNEY